MRAFYLSLAIALTPMMATADHPIPPVPEGGIRYVMEGECQDNETKAEGYCYGGYTADGTFILTFWQDGELKFIRRVVGDSYETVWVAHGFGAI